MVVVEGKERGLSCQGPTILTSSNKTKGLGTLKIGFKIESPNQKRKNPENRAKRPNIFLFLSFENNNKNGIITKRENKGIKTQKIKKSKIGLAICLLKKMKIFSFKRKNSIKFYFSKIFFSKIASSIA